MDKTGLLHDSVRKLISLGVSDEEILESLAEVGVSKEDAKKLIETVRAGAVPQEKPAEGIFEQTAKALGTAQPNPLSQKTQQIPVVPNQEPQIVIRESPSNTQEQIKEKENTISDQDALSEDKINPLDVDFGVEIKNGKKEEAKSKKSENSDTYKKIKSSVDWKDNLSQNSQNSEKVSQEKKENPSEIADKLLKEISNSSPAESQFEKSKGYSKISEVKQSDIEELWKKGIVVAINAKLDEMRKLKDEVDSEINEKVDSAVRKETTQFKVLLDSQKDLIISSNRESLAEKQKEITLIIDSKIAELKKYNREIEENLKKIDSTKIEQDKAMAELASSLESVKKTKSQLIMEMNSELIKSKSQSQEFIERSEKHLKETDERINKTLKLEENISEGLLAKAEQKIEKMTIAKANDIIDELQIELNKIKSIEKEVSIETLDEKIKLLDKFKSEFLNSMQQNLAKINSAIEKLNDKNVIVEKELKGRMLIFDAKIEELSKFEKEFGETMGNYLKKESQNK
jgi:hypothetical protein